MPDQIAGTELLPHGTKSFGRRVLMMSEIQAPQRMPALFIGHGSPMNTLESNRFTSEWKAIAERIAQH